MVAVAGIDLEVRAGEFFTMLGPSGSGKTTTLRMIAGFEDPTSGTIELGGGEFFTLLGPSGCGKTTTLRMIAGFEQPTVGEVLIEGENVAGTAPHKRPTNTVFQSYALFPHLSVEKNVAFGLKRKKVGKDEIAERVATELKRVGLAREAGRRPSQPPAACSSASPWRGRWSTCPRCCCSTSPSARST